MEKMISVIMSTYNEQIDWLKASIESILNQTYRNIEFIIVLDNPNNKDILFVLNEYEKLDSRIKVLINDKNMGLVKSLNRALKNCNGEYIARMDADDISYSDRFEIEVKALEELNVDFVMGSVDFLYNNDRIVTNTFDKSYIGNQFYKVEKRGNISSHPTWLFKASILQKVKEYRFVEHCEDVDFLMRALQSGAKCARLSNHILKYRVRETGVSKKYALEQFLKMRYIRKLFRHDKLLADINKSDWDSCMKNVSEQDILTFSECENKFTQLKINLTVANLIPSIFKTIVLFIKSKYFFLYIFDNIKWMTEIRFM